MNGGWTKRPLGSSDWVQNERVNSAVTDRISGEQFAGEMRMVTFDSDEHERARGHLVTKVRGEKE